MSVLALIVIVGTLEFFIWLILGRIALRLLMALLGAQQTNFFTELFRRGTDPLFYVVRRATFGRVTDRYIPLLTLLLLFLLRVPFVRLLREGG
jgi:hypothetical protein